MRNLIFAILFVSSYFSFSQGAFYGISSGLPKKEVILIVECGQSNLEGPTFNKSNSDPEGIYKYPSPRTKICGMSGSNGNGLDDKVNTFETIYFRSETDEDNNVLGYHYGAEPSLSYQLRYHELYIVKIAWGGSNLHTQWADGSFLKDSLFYYTNYALSYLSERNITVDKYIWYWNQWESDAGRTDYTTNYQDLYDDLVAETGISFDLQIIFKANPSSNSYTSNIATRQSEIIAAYENAELLDCDDLEIDETGVHYFPSGYIEIGNRIGNRIKQLFEPP